MKFSELYKSDSFHCSIEVFPPKTDKGIQSLLTELQKLKAINPAYISVTYGAMGSTQSTTQDLALKVFEQTKVPTAFHFTCVGSSKSDIRNYVETMNDQGLNLVVALRGDVPADQSEFVAPEDGFRYANELVAYLKSLNSFSMAVAGYPEKHPEASDIDSDIQNLKKKVDAGAAVIITQLFYDNEVFYSWAKKVRAAGIEIPIIAGIMPILNLKQIKRITGMCGASLPASLIAELEACQDDADKMKQVGINHAVKQCKDLKANGVQGIHFYCLNKADSVLKIVELLKS